MPIYEYKCRSCEHHFDQLVKSMSDDAKQCPQCGGRKLERLPSVFAARGGESAAPAHGPGPACGGCAQAGSCPMQG